ncbi:hypothetical protein ABPG72_007272 [Tetrahymena utriculariae]
MFKTTPINSFKNVPEIDQRYIQDLQEKDRIVRQRIEKRNRMQEDERQLLLTKVTKTLEYLTTHKKDMQKRNAVFQNDMRGHVERFHREIAKVYVADENLRQTKTVIDNYLRNFRPQVAVQLKNVLQNNNYSLEAKIFNVKNHAPIILSKNNELIRLEQKQRELEQEIVREELKHDIIQTKSTNPQQVKQDSYNKQNVVPNQNAENRELATTQKINQPQQSSYQQYNREQIQEEDDIQKFDQDDSISEDNYATQKNKSSNNQYTQDNNRPSANPNFTQKNLNQNTSSSQQNITNNKSNNETKKRVNNIFDEVANDFDDD